MNCDIIINWSFTTKYSNLDSLTSLLGLDMRIASHEPRSDLQRYSISLTGSRYRYIVTLYRITGTPYSVQTYRQATVMCTELRCTLYSVQSTREDFHVSTLLPCS